MPEGRGRFDLYQPEAAKIAAIAHRRSVTNLTVDDLNDAVAALCQLDG
jgi:hypothetical protein